MLMGGCARSPRRLRKRIVRRRDLRECAQVFPIRTKAQASFTAIESVCIMGGNQQPATSNQQPASELGLQAQYAVFPTHRFNPDEATSTDLWLWLSTGADIATTTSG